MTKQTNDRYVIDPADGLKAEIVGAWSQEKHDRLRKYVDITRKTRAKFERSGTTYIDLYCGPGRVQIKGRPEFLDGSPLVAVRESLKESPFTSVHIADIDSSNVSICGDRLGESATEVRINKYIGKAEETAGKVISQLNPSGLHLAFLDPYNLGALPFSVIEALAKMQRMDMIIHVSEMDLNRNIRLYRESGVLEQFAPGCEAAVDWNQKDEIVRQKVFAFWRSRLESLGYQVGGAERVSGDNNQPFYWLVSVSRHALGKKFWNEVRHIEPQRGFDF